MNPLRISLATFILVFLGTSIIFAHYDTLKPAVTEVDPGIEAADQAIEKGSVEILLKHL